jgi:predicted outer membrane repeat protein
MTSLLLHPRTAWNDHFPGTSPTNTYYSQTYSSRQTISGTNIHVSNCLFSSMTSTSDGGALYCTSATYFLVESTSFFSCKTSGTEGGAIYFVNINSGQSVLYGICCFDCNSNIRNMVLFIKVNNVESSKNYLNYSSISRCVKDDSSSAHLFRLWNGKNCCPSVNVSLNKIYRRSGIVCDPFGSSNSVICSLTYTTFADNHANGFNCIGFWTSGAKYEIKSCNILRNTQGTLDSDGTIYTYGITNIADSCILENKANFIFHQGSSSYTTTLSNCTVDKTSNNRNLIIQNTVTKSFVLALNHMSTQNCHSEYDSAGTLTPIIQTPSSSKKPKLCYTHMKCFNQPRLTDTFEPIFIFIFNFIHSYERVCSN